MKYLIFLAVFCLALIGCNAGGDEINYYTSDAQEMSSYQSLKNLPTCNSSSLGKLAYVEDSSAVFFCNDSSWVRVTKAAEKDTVVIMDSLFVTDSLVIRDSIYVDSISGCTFSKKDGLVAAICDEDTLWFEQTVAPADEKKNSVEKDQNVVETKHEISSAIINDASEYDSESNTLKDLRDNQVYRTATIGSQVWMAENLNYAYIEPTTSLDSSSFCPNDDASECDKYGRLYLWSAAMDSSAVFSNEGKGCGDDYGNYLDYDFYDEDGDYISGCVAKNSVRGVCPMGWHLPSNAEWETLFTTVGETDEAGKKLKSNSGWLKGYNGDDSYGFAVLPAGYREYDGGFTNVDSTGYFWTSSPNDDFKTSTWYFFTRSNNVSRLYNNRNYGFSIRCVKD